MNNDQNSIIFKPQTNDVTPTQQNSSPTRARSFKIRTSIRDYSQYVNTIKAYAQAGLPFEHIANAGEQLGDIVEKGEIETPIQEGWQSKAGEIVEDENKILAWQTRGEKVPINNQLSSAPSKSAEVITISQKLNTMEPTRPPFGSKSEKTIEVVEGINVITQQSSQALENNPYLKPISDLKI